MLFHLLYPLHETYSFFNVFRYITFRAIYAAITSLVICFVIGPWLIRRLRTLQIGQTIREDGPDSHLVKEGTPTMGGILIIFSVTISTLLWANLTVGYIWLVIMVMLGFGLIGFFDEMAFSCELGAWKPNAAAFHHILERLNVAPTEAVYVGDLPEIDILGAQRAGLRAVWMAALPRQLGEIRPDATIQGLSELPIVLERLEQGESCVNC